jgi:hypothetical protein
MIEPYEPYPWRQFGWAEWFAWYPVRTLSGEWVWLETVMYRKGRWGCEYAWP